MWSLDNNVVILLHNIICTIWFIETRYQQERDRYWVEKKSARCKILSILNKHHYQSQDEISPFSRLNGDWMVAEWPLNGDGKGGFQSHFSHHSVDWMAGTFQWPFSQLIFWKIKLRLTRIEPGMWGSQWEHANHYATGTVIFSIHLAYV